MKGQQPLYKAQYAGTSNTGWYEVLRLGRKSWKVLRVYTDGSCDTVDIVESKLEAIAVCRQQHRQ